MHTEIPCLKIFTLHNFQKRDCLCILAHTFWIGLLLLMLWDGDISIYISKKQDDSLPGVTVLAGGWIIFTTVHWCWLALATKVASRLSEVFPSCHSTFPYIFFSPGTHPKMRLEPHSFSFEFLNVSVLGCPNISQRTVSQTTWYARMWITMNIPKYSSV